jgi:hypothetical protein
LKRADVPNLSSVVDVMGRHTEDAERRCAQFFAGERLKQTLKIQNLRPLLCGMRDFLERPNVGPPIRVRPGDFLPVGSHDFFEMGHDLAPLKERLGPTPRLQGRALPVGHVEHICQKPQRQT